MLQAKRAALAFEDGQIRIVHAAAMPMARSTCKGDDLRWAAPFRAAEAPAPPVSCEITAACICSTLKVDRFTGICSGCTIIRVITTGGDALGRGGAMLLPDPLVDGCGGCGTVARHLVEGWLGEEQ